jgi:2Fe-2S ferredoxin
MPKIIYIDALGVERNVDALIGYTVMENAVRNDIPGIEGECGGACACATCHVYVDSEWQSKIPKIERMEEDMLDFAFDIRPNSRLSCQIRFTEELDGLTVSTPTRQA